MERRGFSRPSFGNGDFEDKFEKPVKIGEKYDVEIKEVGSKGDGIARIKNFVVFVANTKQGEKCKIEIKQVSRKFAIGEKVGEAELKDLEKDIEEEEESEEIEEEISEVE